MANLYKQHFSLKPENVELCDVTLAGVDKKRKMANKCLLAAERLHCTLWRSGYCTRDAISLNTVMYSTIPLTSQSIHPSV